MDRARLVLVLSSLIVLAALAASAFADSLIGLYVTGVLGPGSPGLWRCHPRRSAGSRHPGSGP